MSKKFLVSIDHNRLESLNFTFQNLATAPSSPASAQVYYNTSLGELQLWNGSWQSFMFRSGGTFSGRIVTAPGSTSVAGGIQLTSGTFKTTPVAGDAGSLEFNGTSLAYIDSTGTRRILGVSGAGIQSVTLNQPAAGFTITQSGTSNEPIYTFTLNGSLAALQGLSGTGFVRRTGADTFTVDSSINLASQVTGTLPIANGGTGSTTAAGARTALGATTLGSNIFTITNPSAITFPRFNADNTVSALNATDFRAAIGAGTGNGTVTAVTGTAPIVSSGGTAPVISLASGYGDTQNPYASKAANTFLAAPAGTAGAPTFRTIVASDIPTLNQNTTGTAANVTGVVAVANGGTGQTSYVNGELLIGNTTGNTLNKATLTQGTGITITNGPGSITIANAGVTSVNGSTGAISNVALTTGNLSQFAATTSAQLAGVISDETGSGSLVFANSPALSGTPTAPTASAGTNTTQIATTAFVQVAVDAARQGMDVKESVRVATLTNIANLAGGAPNIVDGITLAAGNRVLVRAQTTQSQNGIYVVQTLGTGSNGTWVRASDADTAAKVTPGMFTFVEEGTENENSGWVLTTNGTIVLGTTALTFAQFSGAGQITAGAGLTKTGNTLAVGQGTGIVVDATTVAIDTTVVARKFSQTIGNGSLTSITVTHNLGTQDIVTSIREVATNELVECSVTAATANTATFIFAVAPANNSLRVTVIG